VKVGAEPENPDKEVTDSEDGEDKPLPDAHASIGTAGTVANPQKNRRGDWASPS